MKSIVVLLMICQLIFAGAAWADDAGVTRTRIMRPIFDSPSLIASHMHWRERYIHPVFCPVVLCHGSCGAYEDACVLSEGAILSKISNPQGCAGACR